MSRSIRVLVSVILILQLGIVAPLLARGDFVGDVINAAAAAGGWPSELPEPEALLKLIGIAQGCAGDTSEAGLVSCVNTAIDDPTISAKLGADAVNKIDLGLQVYLDIRDGDYLGLVAILGETAGCAAALVLTGVPVCALAQLLADVASAIADAAGEIYAFLQDLGAHAKVTRQDFYDLHWYPHISTGVQISVFKGASEWSAYVGPMYDGCYKYYRNIDDMSEANATETCQWVQQTYVNAVLAETARLESDTKKAIGGSWDAKAIGWSKQWTLQCNMTSGAAPNIDSLIGACQQKVADALAAGRAAAVGAMNSCKVAAALHYDIPQCVQWGYDSIKVQNALSAAVKTNQALESAYQTSANNPKTTLEKLKNLSARFNNEVGAWLSQCPAGDLYADCRDGLHEAWELCDARMASVPPFKDIGPDPAKLQQVKSQCISSYNGLVSAYGKFAGKRASMAGLSNSCPKSGPDSGVGFAAASDQCAKTVSLVTAKCTGGQPHVTASFFAGGGITQVPPGLEDCSGEVSTFNARWGVDEPLQQMLSAALTAAGNACLSSGAPGCVFGVKARADDCKLSINSQANAVGVIPSAPSFQYELSNAIKNLIASGNACIKAVREEPEHYLNNKATGTLVAPAPGVIRPPAGRPARAAMPMTAPPPTGAPDAATERLLKDNGCVAAPGSRNGYECKTDAGMKQCETFKQAGKVASCKRVR